MGPVSDQLQYLRPSKKRTQRKLSIKLQKWLSNAENRWTQAGLAIVQKKLLSFFTMTVDTKSNDDIFGPSQATSNRLQVKVSNRLCLFETFVL